ncbi:hypothetical protein EVAR_86770_1 [Eumeta japonica]|uniref:Uncharacterized protein n=1 Tax=Eumeta variegata TaxID=151549 RepID=A0A4C1VZ50_EUMVA|nr:hypothetical protein EVAR_86770_1 [Eumeta japonica]
MGSLDSDYPPWNKFTTAASSYFSDNPSEFVDANVLRPPGLVYTNFVCTKRDGAAFRRGSSRFRHLSFHTAGSNSLATVISLLIGRSLEVSLLPNSTLLATRS